MRLLLGLALTLSFNTFAADWNSLEIGNTYELKQSFSLPELERSGKNVDFTAGEKVFLRDIYPLDMIKVILYQFDYANCPSKDIKTDMEIIPVQGTSPVVEAGAQLQNDCVLEVFLETQDLYSESLFK